MTRILVVGCGGIGGNLAAGLGRHAPGVVTRLVALSTNPEIAAAVNAHGYRLDDRGAARVVPGAVVESLPSGDTFDVVLLATQPPQVEEAARAVVDHLAPDGVMVVLQNGLCEDRIARIAGPERVVGAVVGWGASMPAPGQYVRTSAGGFILGRPPGAAREPDPALARLAELLAIVGPVKLTPNLAGARWGKLAINCAISTLGTIGGERLGVLLGHRYARTLGLRIITEVVAVARAEGVALERIGGIDPAWLALTEAEQGGSPLLVLRHALLYGVGLRYRNLRSSMLAAIERGRPPAVDFLNGEIVARGARHGIPTPVNAAAAALVHAIARGEERPALATLERFAASFG